MMKWIFICGLIVLFIWPIFIISGSCSREEERLETKKKYIN